MDRLNLSHICLITKVAEMTKISKRMMTDLFLFFCFFFNFRSLITYSDGCSSQNKNHTIIFYLFDLHKRGIYETLDHKFLVRGHTYLENDRDFTQIDKRKKRSVVYLPEDWSSVIREANLRKPFEVRNLW